MHVFSKQTFVDMYTEIHIDISTLTKILSKMQNKHSYQ